MRRWLAGYHRNEWAKTVVFIVGGVVLLLLVDVFEWFGLALFAVGWLAWRQITNKYRWTHDDSIEAFREYTGKIHRCGPDCPHHD